MEIGNGNLDWKAIIANADKAGCQWYIVEAGHLPGRSVRFAAHQLPVHPGTIWWNRRRRRGRIVRAVPFRKSGSPESKGNGPSRPSPVIRPVHQFQAQVDFLHDFRTSGPFSEFPHVPDRIRRRGPATTIDGQIAATKALGWRWIEGAQRSAPRTSTISPETEFDAVLRQIARRRHRA